MFPLPLVQKVLTDGNGLSDVFKYGIYRVAMFQQTDEENAYRQVIYCYFNIESDKVDDLTDYLRNTLDDIEDIVDEDYRGFNGNGKNFEPDEMIGKLTDYGNKHKEFRDAVIEFHKLRQAKDTLNMRYNIEDVANVYHKYGKMEGEPLVSVKTDIMFSYYNMRNSKKEYDMVLLAMYMGIKSIVGNKNFAATTAEMIKCRMVGVKSLSMLQETLKNNKTVKYFYDTYSTRRKYYKMMRDLEKRGFIQSCVSCNRRTYISCKLPTEELEQEAAQDIVNTSESIQMKRYHAAKRASRIRINEMLKFAINID